MNINSNDVRGMQTLALQSCVSATIPMGIYEGMDTEDSAGHIASMFLYFNRHILYYANILLFLLCQVLVLN